MINKLKSIEAVNYFYIGWIMMVFHFCVANSNANTYSTSLVSYIALLFFLSKICLQKNYKSTQIVKMIITVVLGFLGYYFSKDMRTFWFSIVLVSFKDVNFDKTVKYTFITILFSCVLFILLCFMNIIPDTIKASNSNSHSFGLGHPNMCSAYFTLLTVLYIYLRYHRITYKFLIQDCFFGILLYFFTKSTTGLITLLCILLIFLVINRSKNRLRITNIMFVILIFGIFCFTVIPIFYNDSFSILNKLLTGRLEQAHYYYAKYGIHLFGGNLIEDLTYINTTTILDIGYMKMLINNGLIYYLFVVFGCICLLRKAIQNNLNDKVVLITFFLIYMCTENVSTYIFMNVSMLLLSDFIFTTNNIGGVSKWQKKIKDLMRYQS